MSLVTKNQDGEDETESRGGEIQEGSEREGKQCMNKGKQGVRGRSKVVEGRLKSQVGEGR